MATELLAPIDTHAKASSVKESVEKPKPETQQTPDFPKKAIQDNPPLETLKEPPEELHKEISQEAEQEEKTTETNILNDEKGNEGGNLNKATNYLSAVLNIFSAGSILSTVFKGYLEGRNNILGLVKGKEEEFAYGNKKLSDKVLPTGEKFGWLTFKLGSFLNVIGELFKFVNTKNSLGAFGSLLSGLSVPIQEKITGTLWNTITFGLVTLGVTKEGDKDHLKQKEKASFASLFNIEKIAKEFTTAVQDTMKFIKEPSKHLPFLNKETRTDVLMRTVVVFNSIAAAGGLLGNAFNNTLMRNFFVTIDKFSAALQSGTTILQAFREKWDNSEEGSAARLSALYQGLGSLAFTPGELIYDSKLGKALITLGAGFYGLRNSLMSLTDEQFNDPSNKEGKKLNFQSIAIGIGSMFLGSLTGLLFNKKEKSGNIINKVLKLIEFNAR